MRDDQRNGYFGSIWRASLTICWTRLHYVLLITALTIWVRAVYLSYSFSTTQSQVSVDRISSQTTYSDNTHVNNERIVRNADIDLFIYRRSFKTGSSSMSLALYETLTKQGFTPVIRDDREAQTIVRSEYLRPYSRKLAVLYHNSLHRGYHPYRRAVIADTIRNGFEQVTSFCRGKRRITTCGDEMIDCMKKSSKLITYRWIGRLSEDDETYIDLPLSSAHRALSTTVLRTVFPNASTLQIDVYNKKNTSCQESEQLRAVYNSVFPKLDRQNNQLFERMLAIAGYPVRKDKTIDHKYSVQQLVDAAEETEQKKYNFQEQLVKYRFPKTIYRALNDWQWSETVDGKLAVQQSDSKGDKTDTEDDNWIEDDDDPVELD